MKLKEIKDFLFEYRANLTMYLNGTIGDIELSDSVVHMLTDDEAKIDAMEKIMPDIGLLNRGMDITHSDYDANQKKHLALDLMEKVDKLIKV